MNAQKNISDKSEVVVPAAVAGHHGLRVPEVTWYKHAGLRRLYAMMPILFLGATINGYDGSLLIGLQTMVPWQECKPAARGAVLAS